MCCLVISISLYACESDTFTTELEKGRQAFWDEMLMKATEHFVQGPCYQWRGLLKVSSSHWLQFVCKSERTETENVWVRGSGGDIFYETEFCSPLPPSSPSPPPPPTHTHTRFAPTLAKCIKKYDPPAPRIIYLRLRPTLPSVDQQKISDTLPPQMYHKLDEEVVG